MMSSKWKTTFRIIVLVWMILVIIRFSGIKKLIPTVITKTVEVETICPIIENLSQEEVERKTQLTNLNAEKDQRQSALNQIYAIETIMINTCSQKLDSSNVEKGDNNYEACLTKVGEYVTNQINLWKNK